MIEINKNNITKELRKKISELLYTDEMYYVLLIDTIENYPNDLGNLYINEKNNKITDILHIKNDGNSDFTNFYYTSEEGLKSIACEIKKLNFKNILFAGETSKVKDLLDMLNIEKVIDPDIFYKLNFKKYKNSLIEINSKLKHAKINEEDIKKAGDFMINFFGAETKEQMEKVSNVEEITSKIKKNLYFIEYKNKTVGMARFLGNTYNFSEITGVYIDKNYRNKGLGKQLVKLMIDKSLESNKIPVLETCKWNISAIKTYEALGFEKQSSYAFEFLK